jgi:hypothetical protein
MKGSGRRPCRRWNKRARLNLDDFCWRQGLYLTTCCYRVWIDFVRGDAGGWRYRLRYGKLATTRTEKDEQEDRPSKSHDA